MSRTDDKPKPLTVKEAAAYLTLSKSYLDKLRITGGGPVYYQLGTAIRYEIEDLDAWRKMGRKTSTSDKGRAA